MNLIVAVERYRQQAGLKKSDMAKYFQVEPQNYNNWVYRSSLPKEYFQAAQQLLNSAGNTVREPAAAYTSRGGQIPLLAWEQVDAWVTSGVTEGLSDWLYSPTKIGPRAFALKVHNDVMTSSLVGQRTYPVGIIIFVDPDRSPKNGCRVVATTNGQATFRGYVEDAGRKYLMPINLSYPKVDITDDVKICGVVTGSYLPE